VDIDMSTVNNFRRGGVNAGRRDGEIEVEKWGCNIIRNK
jgi:hypothetical protein